MFYANVLVYVLFAFQILSFILSLSSTLVPILDVVWCDINMSLIDIDWLSNWLMDWQIDIEKQTLLGRE